VISNSFGAALWGVDYALQMAAVNFGGALFHVGGQSVAYNPFTPPPTNQSTFHQWTVGSIYYSALVVAEALGPSNTSQVLDLQANGGNQFSPAYGIWEKGDLARVLLINFNDDPSGQSDMFVSLSMSDASVPSQVQVKYLLSPSVSDIANFTWAGQTFGDNFGSDGRPMGTENTTTVPCSNNVCIIHVPAPGAALVFLNDNGNGGTDATAAGPSTTFSTTTYTKTRNTITIDPSLLATSNGHSGSTYKELGSTSANSDKNGAMERRSVFLGAGVGAAVAVVAGWLVL